MPATTERFTSGSSPITADVFMPQGPGRRPAVLILHGTFGLLPQYRADIVSFAEALTDEGIAAVIPHYFEGTKTEAGLDAGLAIPAQLPAWTAACGDALLFTRSHSSVDAGRLGAIGFSLGGHLALTLGMSPPQGASLKGVVDFFAPTVVPPLHGQRAALPPVLIHHGTNDTTVAIESSEQLVRELRAAGRTEGLGYEFIRYPGQGHGFTGSDLAKSRTTTVEFLDRIL
ncbi:MAG: dienelactone hydrolase family protein [Gemmatimonadaceae bacterium]